MLANLYLHTDALKYNGTEGEGKFMQKFSSLLADLRTIRNNYKTENSIKVSASLSNGSGTLIGQQNIYDIARTLDYEERNFIFSLMGDTSEEYDFSLSEIEGMCAYDENETVCNTLVYLNKPEPADFVFPIVYMTFDRYEIVYGFASWRTLRRQILGNHPGTPEYFMKECEKYFPDIVFHPNCVKSIVDYLDVIPRKIVYYLSCMNDELLNFRATGVTDENVCLANFCTKYGFDDPGSRQSTPKKKKKYQFAFLKCGFEDNPTNYKTITCDPHMKISSCDSNCKRAPSGFVGRIYFHFGDDEIAPGKILVGSIGPHVA